MFDLAKSVMLNCLSYTIPLEPVEWGTLVLIPTSPLSGCDFCFFAFSVVDEQSVIGVQSAHVEGTHCYMHLSMNRAARITGAIR